MGNDSLARGLVERRSLGWGLAVRPVGLDGFTRVDIVLESGAAAEVAGRAALQQDLALAYCTGLGTDPLNPGFGFDGARLIAEEDDRVLLRERLRAAAAVEADADPRVSKVLDVQLDPGASAAGLVRDLRITVGYRWRSHRTAQPHKLLREVWLTT